MQVDRGLILQTQTYNPLELALRRNAVVTGSGTKQIPVHKRELQSNQKAMSSEIKQ